jgi:N-acetylmuramic acid 6-phosphate etherase
MIDGGRLLYLGAGTSGRLGVLDASECPPTFQSDPTQVVGIIAGGDESLRRSSEHREDQREGAQEELEKLGIGSMDTLLGIAAGGTTPWVLGALEYGKSQGCCTALLRCADAGLVEVDHLLELQTGPELLAGSTRLKAGTATKIVLNTITTLVFTRLGKVHGQRMVDLRATNDKLHDRALRILADYVPSLDRAEADRVLSESDGELKTAIVVASKDVTAEAARHALKHAGGRLGDVLGCR